VSVARAMKYRFEMACSRYCLVAYTTYVKYRLQNKLSFPCYLLTNSETL
jgi:hypothetical protein